MPSNSFRKDLGPPPLRYRTPSPPRFAFEPISPSAADDGAIEIPPAQWSIQAESKFGFKHPLYVQSEHGDDTYKYKEGLQGPMDAFATIALAADGASATQSHPSFVHPSSEPTFRNVIYEVERPSKRARSERLQSPEWPREGGSTGTRPATSYEQSSDSRTFEAELLLNFCQKARFSSTQIFQSQVDLDATQGTLGLPRCAPDLPIPLSSALGDHHDKEKSQDTALRMKENFEQDIRDDMIGTISKALEIVPEQGREHDMVQANTFMHTEDADKHYMVPSTNPVHMLGNSKFEGEPDKSTSPDGLEMDPLANNQAENYIVASLAGSSNDEDTQAACANSSHSEDQAPGLDSAGTQLQPQESTPKEVKAALESISDLSKTGTLVDSEVSIPIQGPTPTLPSDGDSKAAEPQTRSATNPSTCAACHFSRNSSNVDIENSSTSWISCDGCKSWFHFACAGFKSEREVRSVDKYRCRKCKSVHGSTTYVRKSSRAHSAIDYAGLNEGVIKTSDERLEHHYIKPIKDGVITFWPETFARMRPELVTADFFEKGNGMKEPVVIPAFLNPRPPAAGTADEGYVASDEPHELDIIQVPSVVEEWFSRDAGLQRVPDHGQDALDMVMPQNLTVRKVAELYGPEEKVEVIDVKSQNGEGKKWNMRRWADYYESSDNKAVRNVISLEVSQSKLGRLIRRPQLVRDLDLQDAVWPQELQKRGEYPRVQLYCLMSVADCFTDFHIDFGGSSVFYHILKGKKTFLFIPPKEKHLKKYEEWCMSPAQNWTFLADQTKECYRVDLSEGDTMLIPAGWIHAVWTPEDSLVIGGNFLSRMHYGMQFRIAQIEKATGVARKFRYPHFQKLHWYTALRYLEEDPLPDSVKELIQDGGTFYRERPAHYDFEAWGEKSKSGSENYHARYYAQAELEGLPDLTRFLLRTALIDIGSITEGITTESRNAVKRAIPRGHGEPLDVVKEFAMWCAWKRGNEKIPDWAYPNAIPEGSASDSVGKLSAATLKKLHQDAALQAPRRQSARMQSQLQMPSTKVRRSESEELSNTLEGSNERTMQPAKPPNPTTPTAIVLTTPAKRKFADRSLPEVLDGALLDHSSKRKKGSRTGNGSHRKPACDVCRKRRRACKHRGQASVPLSGAQGSINGGGTPIDGLGLHEGTAIDPSKPISTDLTTGGDIYPPIPSGIQRSPNGSGARGSQYLLSVTLPDKAGLVRNQTQRALYPDNEPSSVIVGVSVRERALVSELIAPSIENKTQSMVSKGFETVSGNALQSRGRSKACNDCRKSKRRCIHDENGKEDPVKAREAAVPRPAATHKRRKPNGGSEDAPLVKKPQTSSISRSLDQTLDPSGSSPITSRLKGEIPQWAPVAHMDGQLSNKPNPSEDPQHMTYSSPSHEPSHNQTSASGVEEEGKHQRSSSTQVSNPIHQGTHRRQESSEEEVQVISDPPPPSTDPKPTPSLVIDVSPPFLEQRTESFDHPAAASSLVSPPASSHDDAENPTPTTTVSAPPAPGSHHPNLTPSTSSSRYSSRHPKQVQRYTPESGPARRASTSSTGEAAAGANITVILGNSKSGVSVAAVLKQQVPRVEDEGKVEECSLEVDGADEESLKLIKELQAQEHGLRRRGRA